jgi:hypothetical protein
MGFGTSTIVSASYLRLCADRIYLGRALHTYPRATIAGDAIPSCVTPSLAYCRSAEPPRELCGDRVRLLAEENRYRNINLLSIDYASRPRLRSRLTLGG